MSSAPSEVSTCEVCGNTALTSVLDLGLHPMCDDLVPVGDGRTCRDYPIEILFCDRCRTAHQRFQVPKEDLFPPSYHYRSRFTADVLTGMAGLVESCERRLGSLTGKKVVDVGCNDGSLLDFFGKRGAITIGVDPTDAAAEARKKGHDAYQAFFSEETASSIVATHGQPDIVTFTNVFAHIDDLPALLRAVSVLTGPETIVVIENHYLGAVLAGNQFDTFYHEHPRTYSYTSFVYIARSLGLELLSVAFPSRYGGNIRVVLGPPSKRLDDATSEAAVAIAREETFSADFAGLRANIARWRSTKSHELSELVRVHGPLRAKAFPGRAAILVRLLGLGVGTIQCVHEKPGSLKIGNYVPGTRIPIVSDDDLFAQADQMRPLLNLAWHIGREIREYLTRNGYKGQVVDVLSAADFAPASTGDGS